MRFFDNSLIEMYINNNPIKTDPNVFSDYTKAIWILSLIVTSPFYVVYESGISLIFVCLLNAMISYYYSRLKKKSDEIVSYYLCEGIGLLYFSILFQLMAYVFFTATNEHFFASAILFSVLYLLFIFVALAIEFRKIRSLKETENAKSVRASFYLIPAVIGIMIAKMIGEVLSYDATLSLGSVVCAILSFVCTFSVRYILKAHFIIAGENRSSKS